MRPKSKTEPAPLRGRKVTAYLPKGVWVSADLLLRIFAKQEEKYSRAWRGYHSPRPDRGDDMEGPDGRST